MESISSDDKHKVLALLSQIKQAIGNLREWNMYVNSEEDYYASPAGMKNLAASCMLIEAIGESFNRIDRITDSSLLTERKEIPWKDVIGIRNHIAHGYFDIDGGIVFDTVKNELDSLEDATDFFLKRLNSID